MSVGRLVTAKVKAAAQNTTLLKRTLSTHYWNGKSSQLSTIVTGEFPDGGHRGCGKAWPGSRRYSPPIEWPASTRKTTTSRLRQLIARAQWMAAEGPLSYLPGTKRFLCIGPR